jgi:capsular exopolysaccharide synthesis family protein
MDLSIQNLLNVARRWWWILLLAPLIAGGVAFIQVSRQQEQFRAAATVEVNPPSVNADTYTAFNPGIVSTHRELITTSAVLQPLLERLDLPLTEEELRDKVTISPIADTRLMRISVSDPDPEVAAFLANQIAEEFASFARERANQMTGPYRDALEDQIAETLASIETTQDRLRELRAAGPAMTAEEAAEIERLTAELQDLQSTYRDLILNVNQMDLEAAGAQTSVLVVQQAVPPSDPYAPNVPLYTLLAAFAGLCIAVGAIALYEYLDNTTKLDTPFVELTGAPLLASIPDVAKLKERFHQLFVVRAPQSPASEATRLLRANIEFAAASRPITTLTISSSSPAEGKSTITANLATTLAQAGYAVTLIDADLRRPSQHKIFDLPNNKGLSTLLTHPTAPWQSMAFRVPDLSLNLIPSGPVPPNAADLLRSPQFAALLAQLGQDSDLVLIDTPPVLAASDAVVIAAATDATLLICRAGATRIDKLREAFTRLPDTVRVAGIVLNQQPVSRRGDAYYLYYYSDTEQYDQAGLRNRLRGAFQGRHEAEPASPPRRVT